MDNNKKSENEPQIIMPYGYMPYCMPEEEKIDLRELWETLKRRKKIIFSTSGILFLIALFYLVFTTSFYEAKATIEIGKELIKKSDGTLTTKYFDNAESLKQYLDVKYDTAGKYRDKNVTTYLDSVSIPKKSDGFLMIAALGPDNKRATETLQSAINDIIKKHDLYYKSLIQHKQDTINALEKEMAYHLKVELPQLKKNLELLKTVELKKIEDRISFLKNEKIVSLREKISGKEKDILQKQKDIERMQKALQDIAEKDPAFATMTAMQIANLQNDITRLKMSIIDLKAEIKRIQKEQIPDLVAKKRHLLEETLPSKQAQIEKLTKITIPQLKTKIDHVKISMKEPYLVMTHIVGKIYTHDYPVKPKKKLILAVSLITGLMLGIFLAFFLEFISKEEK